jgi:cell division septation protein DedD
VLSAAVLALLFGVLRVSDVDDRGPASDVGGPVQPDALGPAFASLRFPLPSVASASPLEADRNPPAPNASDLALEFGPGRPEELEGLPQERAAAPVAEKPSPTPEQVTPKAADPGAYAIQLTAVSSSQKAEKAWSDLAKRHRDLLGQLSPRVEPAELDGVGAVYRLQAGPLKSEQQARNLCAALEGRGQDCLIVRNR